MQGLWSRAAQSSSSCRCVACLRTAANGVTSRTTTAASRRRLRIGNAVTALYSSIFAGAALADAKAKDKRRLEWEQKIAAVKEEVNEMVNEENRILEALASRQTRKNASRPFQTRQFSTSARNRQGISQAERYGAGPSSPSVAAENPDEGLDDPSSPTSSGLEDPLFDYAENADERIPESDAVFDWSTGDILRIKAIQKLALKQLAIRFLLRPVVAPNYIGLPMDYASLAELSALPRFSSSELLDELHVIRRRMRALKCEEKKAYDDLVHDMHIQEYHELRGQRHEHDAELQNDINLFLNKAMSLPELLLRISNNLLSSPEPDRPKAFQLMIMAFTKTRQNDLVELVLRAVLPNLFELTQPLIISIFTYFRKSKNLKDFDQFLQMLRGESGYPVNLTKMTLYEKKVINGVEITVPPQASCDPVICGALIAAALRFDQADRAEAWLQVWRANGFVDNFSTLCAFLKFYGHRKDWESGLYTLLRALAFMTSSTDHPQKRIERLILHMVHFCDSCGQEDVATALIDAAVRSGFNWRMAYRETDISYGFDSAFQRWRSAAKATDFTRGDTTISEKCYEFTTLASEKITQLTDIRDDALAELRRRLVRSHSTNLLSAMSIDRGQKMEGKRISNSMTDSTGVKSSSSDIQSGDGIDPSGRLKIPTTVVASTRDEELRALQEEMARLKTIVAKISGLNMSEQAEKVPESEVPDQNIHVPSENAMQPMTPRETFRIRRL